MEMQRMAILSSVNFCATSEGVKPLAVTVKCACKMIGVGNTKMWALIKEGRVQTTSVGRRRLVIYSSLEDLVTPDEKAKS
jgi:excisionase family DNA binding protein